MHQYWPHEAFFSFGHDTMYTTIIKNKMRSFGYPWTLTVPTDPKVQTLLHQMTTNTMFSKCQKFNRYHHLRQNSAQDQNMISEIIVGHPEKFSNSLTPLNFSEHLCSKLFMNRNRSCNSITAGIVEGVYSTNHFLEIANWSIANLS